MGFSLGSVFKYYISSANFCATFFHGTSYPCINFDKKLVWATFWATFSQTHLVTLIPPANTYYSKWIHLLLIKVGQWHHHDHKKERLFCKM
jgi:hypothetical protein